MSDFENELARRTLISEQRRTTIPARVLAGLVLFAMAFAVLRLRRESLPGFGWILLIAGVGCGYQ